MDRLIRSLKLLLSNIAPHPIRLFWLILAMGLFVLGAGAPGNDPPGGW